MEKGPSPAIQACSRSSLLCSQQLVPHRGGAEQDGSKAKRQQPGQDTSPRLAPRPAAVSGVT